MDYTPFEEQVAAIAELIREGKVRQWGLSNETTFGAMRFAAAADAIGAPRPASIQNCINLVHRCASSQCKYCFALIVQTAARRRGVECLSVWNVRARVQDVRGRAGGGVQPAAPQHRHARVEPALRRRAHGQVPRRHPRQITIWPIPRPLPALQHAPRAARNGQVRQDCARGGLHALAARNRVLQVRPRLERACMHITPRCYACHM